MENKSKYPEYNFLNAKAVMEELYEVRMPEDKFLEKAYYAWKELPNMHTNYHVLIEKVNLNNRIELPENVDYIMNVNHAMYFYTNRYGLGTDSEIFIYRNGSRLTSLSSQEWESYRVDKSISDRYSPNLTYELGNGYITFPQGDLNGVEVAILYKGLIVDENCDPLLYYREVQAIAARVNYYNTRISARKRVPGAAELLMLDKQESDKAITRAGMPEAITDNEIDRVLNAMTSYDRKYFNRKFKFKS